MLDGESIKKLASLSRISLTEEELGNFGSEIEIILEYVSVVKGAETGSIEDTLADESGMREDVARNEDEETLSQLIKLAPKSEDNKIKVQKILN